MKGLKDSLNEAGNLYVAETGITMAENGQVVTGATRDSMRIEVDDNEVRVYIARYAGVLQDGRKPGEVPPIDAIRKWIQAKGLNLNPYAVAKKIASEGTQLFRGDAELTKPTDTFTKAIPKTTKFVRKEIANIVSSAIRGAVTEGFK